MIRQGRWAPKEGERGIWIQSEPRLLSSLGAASSKISQDWKDLEHGTGVINTY